MRSSARISTATITSWNKGAERVFGYTAEETIGQPVTMLIPPDRLEEEPDILARLKRGERVDHFETVRRAEGRDTDRYLAHDFAGEGRTRHHHRCVEDRPRHYCAEESGSGVARQ